MSIDPVVCGLIFQGIIAILFIGSFFVALYNLRVFKNNHNTITLKNVLDDYRALLKSGVFSRYEEDLEKWKTRMASSDFQPMFFYYNEMPCVSEIGQFYELVGVLVRNDLIDLNLLFEILPFPDQFWRITFEFRKAMQEITYEHFWDNFEDLRVRYTMKRKSRKPPKKKREVLLANKDQKKTPSNQRLTKENN